MRTGALVQILNRTKNLLDRKYNDFSLSTWNDARTAMACLDRAFGQTHSAAGRQQLKKLFAPFGPVHQVAIGSGWVPEFVEVSTQFDRLISEP